MARIVDSPKNQVKHLAQQLTEGEMLVLDFLDKHLNEAWEIYVHPHLSGLQPDFVLLNPDVGIGVFEVKDWNLKSPEYRAIKTADGRTVLEGCKGEKRFLNERSNPVSQVLQYRSEIYDLYCPRLERPSGIAAITGGIIFPFAEEEEIFKLILPLYGSSRKPSFENYLPIAGKESLEKGAITQVFPTSEYIRSKYMTPELAEDLRAWLREPDYIKEQRTPLELSSKQIELIKVRGEPDFIRIKGPPGSGKSIVLASKAAQLAVEGKDVLVITYNITMLNYLKDLAVRYAMRNLKKVQPGEGSHVRKGITWLNFHLWCRRVCFDSGEYYKYRRLWRVFFEHVGEAIEGDEIEAFSEKDMDEEGQKLFASLLGLVAQMSA